MNEEIRLNRMSAVRQLMGVQVLATGSYVPDNIVHNKDLAALGCDEQWIVQRTGIHERRHAPPEQTTSDLATEAARHCIDASGIDPAEIDLLVLGTFTPDMPVPATACRVQENLNLSCAAMDIQAACSGFMYSLVTGAQFIATGSSRHVLVIGAECNSRVVNPTDVSTYPLFGDGAGAVLLSPGEEDQGLAAYTLGSDGSGAELLCQPMGGAAFPPTVEGLEKGKHYLHMEGRPVFKWAIRLLAETTRQVLDEAKLSIDEIDLVILHQANRRIIDSATEAMNVDPAKVVINLDRYGNTSAASIPLALDECAGAGRIKRGSQVLMSGFGAGLTWGTAVFRW